MRKWSERSRRCYDELDPRLQNVMDYVLEHVADVTLTTGHRTKEAQNMVFAHGFSKVQWPNGKHNKLPSIAVDLQPYPFPTDELKLRAALGYIAGRAIEYGRQHGIKLRWGGDWNGNGDVTDQNFDDLFHIELRDD